MRVEASQPNCLFKIPPANTIVLEWLPTGELSGTPSSHSTGVSEAGNRLKELVRVQKEEMENQAPDMEMNQLTDGEGD